jgi:predicted ATPase with chaperone activity
MTAVFGTTLPVIASVSAMTPHSQLSSSGLTGRSSIAETSAIESTSRGVLDAPHARGMTAVFWTALPVIASMSAMTPHSQLSSSGLTGRSSIPETSAIESISRGVLDAPHARGMTAVGGCARRVV